MAAPSRIAPIASQPVHQVAAERTPVSPAQLRTAIARAYQRATGHPPTAPLLETLTAQASVETGRGSSMYNFNFGGIKGAGPHGDTASCLTHEVVGEKTLTLHQSFRAYSSLDEGADDYVRLLSAHFSGALSRAQVGDVDGFAHALKQAGYYTASESDYASALRGTATGGSAAEGALLPVPTATQMSEGATSADVSRVLDALSSSALRIMAPAGDDDG